MNQIILLPILTLEGLPIEFKNEIELLIMAKKFLHDTDHFSSFIYCSHSFGQVLCF